MDGWSAHLNGFHGGLDAGITSLHGALALEIDYSLQSFRGSSGNFAAGYGRREFSRRINTCDISFQPSRLPFGADTLVLIPPRRGKSGEKKESHHCFFLCQKSILAADAGCC